MQQVTKYRWHKSRHRRESQQVFQRFKLFSSELWDWKFESFLEYFKTKFRFRINLVNSKHQRLVASSIKILIKSKNNS